MTPKQSVPIRRSPRERALLTICACHVGSEVTEASLGAKATHRVPCSEISSNTRSIFFEETATTARSMGSEIAFRLG